MGRVLIVCILQITVSMIMLSERVNATDGDMDYSAPYITVDPETGQLVTKNPGPRLKSHPQDFSTPTQADTTTVKTDAIANQPAVDGSGNLSIPDNQQIGSASIITIIATGLMVFAALAFRRFRQRQ